MLTEKARIALIAILYYEWQNDRASNIFEEGVKGNSHLFNRALLHALGLHLLARNGLNQRSE